MENIIVPVPTSTTIAINPETNEIWVTPESASIEIYQEGGPRGPQGPPGAGLLIKGTVATAADLPSGQRWGDLWIALDTGHGWVWQYPNEWADVGPIQGAPGPPGADGAPGPPGQGLQIRGHVATAADLPTAGNVYGDLWIALDTGHGWLWESPGVWTDIGPLQGPAGPPGAPGPPGKWPVANWSGTFTPPAAGSTTTLTVNPGEDLSWASIDGICYVRNFLTDGTPQLIGDYKIVGINLTALTLTLENLPPLN